MWLCAVLPRIAGSRHEPDRGSRCLLQLPRDNKFKGAHTEELGGCVRTTVLDAAASGAVLLDAVDAAHCAVLSDPAAVAASRVSCSKDGLAPGATRFCSVDVKADDDFGGADVSPPLAASTSPYQPLHTLFLRQSSEHRHRPAFDLIVQTPRGRGVSAAAACSRLPCSHAARWQRRQGPHTMWPVEHMCTTCMGWHMGCHRLWPAASVAVRPRIPAALHRPPWRVRLLITLR